MVAHLPPWLQVTLFYGKGYDNGKFDISYTSSCCHNAIVPKKCDQWNSSIKVCTQMYDVSIKINKTMINQWIPVNCELRVSELRVASCKLNFDVFFPFDIFPEKMKTLNSEWLLSLLMLSIYTILANLSIVSLLSYPYYPSYPMYHYYPFLLSYVSYYPWNISRISKISFLYLITLFLLSYYPSLSWVGILIVLIIFSILTILAIQG